MTTFDPARAVPHPTTGRSTYGLPARSFCKRGAVATLLRLHLTYLWRHRRLLSLNVPKRFTELIQRRKLIDHDPLIPLLTDKLAVKATVADLLGPDWITPTLWTGTTLPTSQPFAPPFVVKSRHGCKQVRIVRRENGDWQAVRRAAMKWMRRPYGQWLDEWGYRDVPRGLMIETFIGDEFRLPIDYKFYVFHGRVEAIQVHVEREHCHRWALYDRDWQRLSNSDDFKAVVPPPALARMIAGAETLGSPFDFVRVDLYDLDGAPRFGEMTFYPGSGLDRFDPHSLDDWLGRCWRRPSGSFP